MDVSLVYGYWEIANQNNGAGKRLIDARERMKEARFNGHHPVLLVHRPASTAEFRVKDFCSNERDSRGPVSRFFGEELLVGGDVPKALLGTTWAVIPRLAYFTLCGKVRLIEGTSQLERVG